MDGRLHGGIACDVRESLPTVPWQGFGDPNLETLWLTIRPPHAKILHTHRGENHLPPLAVEGP